MIPAVEGLLPEPYNGRLLTLLYRLAEWHALGKLRMHTEHTLRGLDEATTAIGHELRAFREWTRTGFTVRELPGEVAARKRRIRKKQSMPGGNPSQTGTALHSNSHTAGIDEDHILLAPVTQPSSAQTQPLSVQTAQPSLVAAMQPSSDPATELSSDSAKVKILNLCTYKLHALGDYVRTIRLFGTTDSYSTQIVCG